MSGFHSFGYEKCQKDHCKPVEAHFPLEALSQSLSEVQSLDFGRLWAVVAENPIEQLHKDRMEVYELTSDPHPKKIFNTSSSAWFQNLIVEKVDAERYHCTFIGSYNFVEVSQTSF